MAPTDVAPNRFELRNTRMLLWEQARACAFAIQERRWRNVCAIVDWHTVYNNSETSFSSQGHATRSTAIRFIAWLPTCSLFEEGVRKICTHKVLSARPTTSNMNNFFVVLGLAHCFAALSYPHRYRSLKDAKLMRVIDRRAASLVSPISCFVYL